MCLHVWNCGYLYFLFRMCFLTKYCSQFFDVFNLYLNFKLECDVNCLKNMGANILQNLAFTIFISSYALSTHNSQFTGFHSECRGCLRAGQVDRSTTRISNFLLYLWSFQVVGQLRMNMPKQNHKLAHSLLFANGSYRTTHTCHLKATTDIC